MLLNIERLIYDDRSSKDRATPQPSVLAQGANQTTQAIEQGATKVDNETNSEGTSGKDGGKMKLGDKVWVKATVVEVDNTGARLTTEVYGQRFWAANRECRHECDMLDGTERITNYKTRIEVQGE
jgi:hypothetical protein